MRSHETTLTKLSIVDEAFYGTLLGDESSSVAESHLDEKTHALVRLGALIATEATAPVYMWSVEAARRGGAPEEEIVGCLIAALAVVGVARVVAAAPKLGLALGYDITSALEEPGVDEAGWDRR